MPAAGQTLDPNLAASAQQGVGNAAVQELLQQQQQQGGDGPPGSDGDSESGDLGNYQEKPEQLAGDGDDAGGGDAGAPPPGGGTPAGDPSAAGPPPGGGGGVGDGGGAEGVAATAADLDSASPAALLKSLEAASASQLLPTYGAAHGQSTGVLDTQRQELVDALPEIETPTGMLAAGAQATAVTEVDTDVSVDAGDLQVPASSTPEPVIATEVPDIPAAPAQPTTTLQEGPTTAPTGEQTGDQTAEGPTDDTLARSGQAALSEVRFDTRSIPSSTGIQSHVPLTGEADPARMNAVLSEGDVQIAQAGTDALAALSTDFGEAAIAPAADDSMLSPTAELSPVPSLQAPIAEGTFALPAALSADLDAQAGPELTQRMTGHSTEFHAGDATFTTDVETANTDAQTQIDDATQQTTTDQVSARDQAVTDVARHRQDWQSDVDGLRADAQQQALTAHTAQLGQIRDHQRSAQSEARGHIADAESRATAERSAAERSAEAKRAEAEESSGGFWGWVKSKVKSFIDGIKSAVNAIYDALRTAVKAIFDAASWLVKGVIEVARMAIVGIITAYGEVLKGILRVALAAFPEVADRYCGYIDQAVTATTDAVNTLAEGLKTVVGGIIDFLGSTIDKLLSVVQGLYNAAFTLIGMMVTGEWKEILEGLTNLVDAAMTAPGQFETAAYEELLGGNLDEPLAPEVLLQAGITPPGMDGSGQMTEAGIADLLGPPWTTDNVGVDSVAQDFELSDALMQQVMAETGGSGEVMFGMTDDPSRSMDAILGQTPEGEEQQQGPTAGEIEAAVQQVAPDDGLDPRQRATVKWDLMKQGISTWWNDNWPMVLAGGILGVGAFIGLNILTGGAITAALPAIMAVVGPLFVGVMAAQIGSHVQDYVTKGWAGDTQGGGKSLAKALAAGAIELIGLLTFKAGGLAIKGAQRAARGARSLAQGAVNTGRGMMAVARRGADFVLDQGKVVLKGLQNTGVGRAVQRLDDLGTRLLGQTRFRGFRIQVSGSRFELQGKINPWVTIASGKVSQMDDAVGPNTFFQVDDVADFTRRNAQFIDEIASQSDEALEAMLRRGDLSPDELNIIQSRLNNGRPGAGNQILPDSQAALKPNLSPEEAAEEMLTRTRQHVEQLAEQRRAWNATRQAELPPVQAEIAQIDDAISAAAARRQTAIEAVGGADDAARAQAKADLRAIADELTELNARRRPLQQQATQLNTAPEGLNLDGKVFEASYNPATGQLNITRSGSEVAQHLKLPVRAPHSTTAPGNCGMPRSADVHVAAGADEVLTVRGGYSFDSAGRVSYVSECKHCSTIVDLNDGIRYVGGRPAGIPADVAPNTKILLD